MIELRALKDLAELRSCVDLQNATWGEGYSEAAPTSVLQVSQKTGGFFEAAMGYRQIETPENSPRDLCWLEMAPEQQIHLVLSLIHI